MSQAALVVLQPFGGYAEGQVITDPAAIAVALAVHPEFVVPTMLGLLAPSTGVTVTSGATGNGGASVSNIAALRGLGAGQAGAVLVQGHAAPGDGGDRWVYWSAGSTAADDGATVLAPGGSSGAGRWVAALGARPTLNVRWFGALGDGSTDDSAAFTAAIAAAAARGIAVSVPTGRYPVSLAVTDADVWLVGEGTLVHRPASTVLSVTRTPGPALPVSAIGPILLGTVAGNAFADTALTTTMLTVRSVAGIARGQVYVLSSQDAYPWSPVVSGVANTGVTSAQVWQTQLLRVQGLGLGYTGGTPGAFLEGQTVTGRTSGATALVTSLSDGAAGTLVFESITGVFQAGEPLAVAGTVLATAAGLAFVLVADRIYDTYTTAVQMQLMPQGRCILEGLSIDSSADPSQLVGQAARLPAVILSGCYQPVLRGLTIRNAWTRALQLLSCFQGDVDVFVERLPNNANLSEGAYGYGVELAGSTDGTRVRVRGGNCRHAVTTNVFWGGFQYMGIWVRGNPKHCLIHDSIARDCFNAGFDTHWGCYFMAFENCVVHGPSHLNRNVSASIGFQNRGFGTRYSDCQVIDAVDAFVDNSTNLAASFIHTVRYVNCHAIDYQQNGFLANVASVTGNNRLEYDGCSARGDGRGPNAPYLQSGFCFANSNYVRMLRCSAERFNAYPIQIAGLGRIEIFEFFAHYRDNPASASGLRFNGAPVEIQISDYRAFFDLVHGAPVALFRNAFAGPLALNLSGAVTCVNSDRAALVTNTAGGTTSVVWRDYGYAAANPQPRAQAGRWYGPACPVAPATPAAGALSAVPYACTASLVSLTALGVLVTTAGAGGSLIRLGVYADAGGLPGALLLDAGTVAGDTVGEQVVATTLALTRGTYWLGALLQAPGSTAPVLSCVAGGTGAMAQSHLGGASPKAVMGVSATLGVLSAGTLAVTALPATFPAPGFVTTGAVPYVALQLSPSTT